MEIKETELTEKNLEQASGGRHNIRSPLKSIVVGAPVFDSDEITQPGYQSKLPGGFTSASICKYSLCHGSVCPSYDLCNDRKKQSK